MKLKKKINYLAKYYSDFLVAKTNAHYFFINVHPLGEEEKTKQKFSITVIIIRDELAQIQLLKTNDEREAQDRVHTIDK